MKINFEVGQIVYRPSNGFYKIVAQAINANCEGATQYTIEACDTDGKPTTRESYHVFEYDLKQAIIATDENRAALSAIELARKEVASLINLLMLQYSNAKDNDTRLRLMLQIKALKTLI